MTTENPDRLEIGWDDLRSRETVDYANQMQQAQSMPLVRNVGQAAPETKAWYRGRIVQLTLAGLLGGLLAWGLIEVFTSPDRVDTSEADPTLTNVIFTMVVGFGIGIVLASWEGIEARSIAKIGNSLKLAVPILLGTTLAAGLLANEVYKRWIDSIVTNTLTQMQAQGWTEQEALDHLLSQMHLPRGVAWAIVGLGAGLGVGLATRQRQRAINGAIGGLVGGFLGGVLFDFFTSGPAARAFGLALTGLAIGLAIGLVEVARRQHWLEIVTGGMAGKQFILYGDTTSVGSGPDNDVTLIKDAGIMPTQLRLVNGPRGLSLAAVDPMSPTLVNGVPVVRHDLADGDTIQLGTTVLRYRSKADQAPVVGPIAG